MIARDERDEVEDEEENKVDCSYRGKKREASGAERLPVVSVVSVGKRRRRKRRREEEEL